MQPVSLHWHEADLSWRIRLRDVVDGETRREAPAIGFRRGFLEFLCIGLVVGALVGERGLSKQILAMDHQQQVVVSLEMNVPGIGWRGGVGNRLGIGGIPDIDNAEALEKAWPI